jgi:hypothetical protein
MTRIGVCHFADIAPRVEWCTRALLVNQRKAEDTMSRVLSLFPSVAWPIAERQNPDRDEVDQRN